MHSEREKKMLSNDVTHKNTLIYVRLCVNRATKEEHTNFPIAPYNI